MARWKNLELTCPYRGDLELGCQRLSRSIDIIVRCRAACARACARVPRVAALQIRRDDETERERVRTYVHTRVE